MSVFNRLKWVLGILLIFLLIITTNLIDRHSFERVKNSITSIYEDRLVAKEIIVELLFLTQEKEKANLISDSDFYATRNPIVNGEIEGLIARFLDTELTQKEENTVRKMQENYQRLKSYEKSISPALSNDESEKLTTQVNEIKANLHTLSKIQMAEGKRQLAITQKEFDYVNLYTKIEIYFLVFLAVVIQIIILYEPK